MPKKGSSPLSAAAVAANLKKSLSAAAEPFVSKAKSPTSNSNSNANAMASGSTSAPPPPPPPVHVIVNGPPPPNYVMSMPPPPPPPAAPPSPSHPPPQYSQTSTPRTPTNAALLPVPTTGTGSPTKILSHTAAPYTPTKQRSPNSTSAQSAKPAAASFPGGPASSDTSLVPNAATPPTPAAAASSAPHPSPLNLNSSNSSVAAADKDKSPASPSFIPFATSKLAVPPTPMPAPADGPFRFNCSWSLYADNHPATIGERNAAFAPVLIKEVVDIEVFWRLWRYLTPPSRCIPAFTYQWFRRDIKPSWEEPRNRNGGTISITVYDKDKAGLQNKDLCDDAFLLMVLAVTGESLDEAAIVNGIVMKIRKTSQVQLWTSCSDEARLKALGQGVRKVLRRVMDAKLLEKPLEFFSTAHLEQQASASAKPAGGKGAASSGRTSFGGKASSAASSTAKFEPDYLL